MVHLTTVQSPFAARVLMARLGTEGILTEVRGFLDGPYPALGEVDVLVEAAQENWARVLLDAVEESRSDYDEDVEDYQHPAWVTRNQAGYGEHRWSSRGFLGLVLAGLMLVCLALISMSSL